MTRLGLRRSTQRLLRVPGLHRLLHRHRDKACWLCTRVWRDFERDPEFTEGLRRGEADIRAGRWYSMNPDGTTTPNPDWPKDGPQPERP